MRKVPAPSHRFFSHTYNYAQPLQINNGHHNDQNDNKEPSRNDYNESSCFVTAPQLCPQQKYYFFVIA
jgi:hypothetical protein